MKDLFSPDSHWHDLGEVKYELLFPRRLLQFLQHDDFPKTLSKLECGTYLLFPEQQGEQSGLAAPLDEPDWDGNGSGATAGGISWEFTPCNRAGQHSQEGEGEAIVYFWIQRFILAIGALLLHAGPEGDTRSERGAGLEGASSASFGRQPQQKGSPVAWRMVPVSKLSMCLQDIISILKLLAENFPFHPPSSHSPQLSIPWPKQICKKIKIIFVTNSLFLMKWLNVQEMKLLGAGVLME